MPHSLFYDWKRRFKPVVGGGRLVIQLMKENSVFEQPLALTGSVRNANIYYIVFSKTYPNDSRIRTYVLLLEISYYVLLTRVRTYGHMDIRSLTVNHK